MRHHHVCLAELKKTTKNFVKIDQPAKKKIIIIIIITIKKLE